MYDSHMTARGWFWHNFGYVTLPNIEETIRTALVNPSIQSRIWTEGVQSKLRVLTKEILKKAGNRLERSHWKSLRRLAHETAVGSFSFQVSHLLNFQKRHFNAVIVKILKGWRTLRIIIKKISASDLIRSRGNVNFNLSANGPLVIIVGAIKGGSKWYFLRVGWSVHSAVSHNLGVPWDSTSATLRLQESLWFSYSPFAETRQLA
jgi:hypothetical protein